MKTGIKVCDAMTSEPYSMKPGESIRDCSEFMAKKRVGSMLVMNGVQLVGLVTEQDLVRKVLAKNLDAGSTSLRDVMVADLKTISPEMDIYDALVMMRDNNFRHLPVLEGSNLVGYVTSKDILKIQPHLFESLADIIELREEERKLRFTASS